MDDGPVHDDAATGEPGAPTPRHVPVLLERAVDLLGPAITRHDPAGAGAVMIDATLGLGGHSAEFLRRFPWLHVIGIDRDTRALAIATERLAAFGDRLTPVHQTYDNIPEALAAAGRPAVDSVDAILLDLGVSSMQLDSVERGFAYSVDAPLDMRMDTTTGPTAADLLNTASHGEIARILSTYGEERFAGRIASEIVRVRERTPFTSSGQLVEVLYKMIPAATRRTGGHPAKRTFQALRIAVNGELDSLEHAVPRVIDALAVGGRAVFMSYQSLEDKVIKRIVTPLTKPSVPDDFPTILPGHEAELTFLTRGVEKATEEEQRINPRSAPVRLRAIERVNRRAA
ncbi:16S rRNA (cytosine(1402)-N(4))-methyltransferase RsmH [Millisia brevis]|uniref:16S rRNA (cytosine(1402)-N(4))-methyltransferase RsmH n=1 Tax=Millisia brevis TaxID=264148 RepID=UPI00082A4ED7|nr:16S rRNA (cytosine(1402)-N(4))-methyltransferase RsmH [Millisia brevis]